ncbi:MAG TPA: hypothetical protein VH592_12560 [Gemmataceae bacterium]
MAEADFAVMRQDPDIASLLTRIVAVSADRPYIDVGCTATPLVPLIIATFPGRVRLVHLVREPVSTAASCSTLGDYYPDSTTRRDAFHYLEKPNPLESSCAHPVCPERWEQMSPFEKAMWRWAEYNLFALAVHERHPEVPYLRLRADRLFRDVRAVGEVAEFYGLPTRILATQSLARNATNPNLTNCYPLGNEWRRYVEYPYILELAEQLDVAVDEAKLEKQMKKYAAPTCWELWKYRWRQRFTAHWVWSKVGRLGSLVRKPGVKGSEHHRHASIQEGGRHLRGNVGNHTNRLPHQEQG